MKVQNIHGETVRGFAVVVERPGRRPLRYPIMDGERAARLMMRLAERGCRSKALTYSDLPESDETLDVSEMNAIFGIG